MAEKIKKTIYTWRGKKRFEANYDNEFDIVII